MAGGGVVYINSGCLYEVLEYQVYQCILRQST